MKRAITSVGSCIGYNLLKTIKESKTDIFLTIYSDNCFESITIMKVLDEIVEEAKSLNVKLLKINVNFNYVPLEYTHSKYPVHFFIPLHNRDERTVLYQSNQQSKMELMQCLQRNSTQENCKTPYNCEIC